MASVSFANTGKVEFLISKNINCFNYSFCSGPPFVQNLGVTAYADHTFSGTGVTIQYTAKGSVAYSATEVLIGTWVVVSGYFVITGSNTTTIVMGDHATTTTTHYSNEVTNVPATPTKLDCAQMVGAPCPKGVTASETVVKVS